MTTERYIKRKREREMGGLLWGHSFMDPYSVRWKLISMINAWL